MLEGVMEEMDVARHNPVGIAVVCQHCKETGTSSEKEACWYMDGSPGSFFRCASYLWVSTH
eukprot:8948453-Prorocentrum_lima.AAC.1